MHTYIIAGSVAALLEVAVALGYWWGTSLQPHTFNPLRPRQRPY